MISTSIESTINFGYRSRSPAMILNCPADSNQPYAPRETISTFSEERG
jgi:hypothetical protein